MSEQSVSQSDTSSLDHLTLALVVSGLGVCTDETVADLRRYVESKAISHTAVEFDASLERAKRHFAEGGNFQAKMESPAHGSPRVRLPQAHPSPAATRPVPVGPRPRSR